MNSAANVIHFRDWKGSYIPNILKELYLDRVYDRYLHDKKDLTIFDLGANIGLFSLYASPFAKKVYAFEPASETHAINKMNLTENKADNVELFHMAIAKEDGKITMYKNENSTMNSTMQAVENKPELKEEVVSIRLDTFVKDKKIEKIDFMKMDIEGTECEVIGSKSFENIVPILDAFVVEYHSWSGVHPQQLVTTIRDYGFHVEQIPSEAVILGCVKK